MKKLLLFGLALGIAAGGFAQKTMKKADNTMKKERIESSFDATTSNFAPRNVALKSGKMIVVDRVEMGKSGNIYSVLTSFQRCLAYDDASASYLGTHRADPASYSGASSSGTMMAHVSSDGGATWDHVISLNPDVAVYALRYPSGVLYNPEGSSDPADVYTVQSGPSHEDGTWNNTFFAVSKFDASNQSVEYYEWESDNDWARTSMTTVGDKVYQFGQDYETAGDLGLNQTMKQYVGTTDDAAEGFDWEYNAATPDWMETEGHSIALYTTWSAWSADGSIGYMWLVGVTNDSYDYGVYQPAIVYTTDGGDSWDDIELNLEDNEVLVEYLPAAVDGNEDPLSVKPSFLTGDRTYPGVVDYNGDLHLFSNVYGSSKGDVLDPDNGYWIVGDVQGGHIFDFVIDANGVKDVIFVDSIMTKETAADAFADLGWDHRLQASRSADGTKVFAVWTDQEDSEDQTVRNPDIHAWGYNVQTSMHTLPVNFTTDDLFSGFYFYTFVSEVTPDNDGTFNIPISTTITPTEYDANDPLAPCTHTFLRNIGFDEEEFDIALGINDNFTTANNISVSQNIPNPFNGSTRITVTTETSANVMVEVTNIMGQTIYTSNEGRINGTKEITLNANNMEAGVYFYTVTVGNNKTTKKMIVK